MRNHRILDDQKMKDRRKQKELNCEITCVCMVGKNLTVMNPDPTRIRGNKSQNLTW
jgi:hypothetical protein